MREDERGFNPEEPEEGERDISQIYMYNKPQDFYGYLSGLDKHAGLVLRVQSQYADLESITYLINNFPNARVELTADPEFRHRMKDKFPISVEWKEK